MKNIRSGTPKESDVNTLLKHVHRTYNCQTDTEEIYFFPTVVQCRNHNKDMLTKLQEKQTLYTFHAKDCQIIETPTSNQRVNILTDVPEDIIPKDERQCAGLAQTFIFAVGAVVMLRHNEDTSACLVNGARGIITAVDLQSPTEVSAIHVRFVDKRFHCHNSNFCLFSGKKWIFTTKDSISFDIEFGLYHTQSAGPYFRISLC